MILGLHHPAISTPDMDRALAFYCDLMGAKLIKQGKWDNGNNAINERVGLKDSATKTAMVQVGHVYIELFEFSVPETHPRKTLRQANEHGITHLCFVVDNCIAEYERLKKAGVSFHAPPLTMPTGASFTYGRDPDGNIFELLEIPAQADFPNPYA